MIELQDIVVKFRHQLVLDHISLKVPENKITAIIGASGGGKSTILRTVMGFVKPVSGHVVIEGETVTHFTEKEYRKVRSKMGMVFQNGALFDSLTVEENVAFYPYYHKGMKWREARERVKDLLKAVGLEGQGDKYPSQLSGGMRKRAALARTLIYEPRVLLYDEPTTGLDPIMTSVVDDIIKEMQEKFHVTSLMVSHDMQSVYSTADYIVMLYGHKLIEIGTPHDMRHSADEVVRSFVKALSVHHPHSVPTKMRM